MTQLTPEQIEGIYETSDKLQATLLHKLGKLTPSEDITELIDKIEKCRDVVELFGLVKESLVFLLPCEVGEQQ